MYVATNITLKMALCSSILVIKLFIVKVVQGLIIFLTRTHFCFKYLLHGYHTHTITLSC